MKRVLGYMKPYAGIYALAAVLTLLTTVADLALPHIMKNIINIGIANGDTGYIVGQGIWMLSITAADILVWFAASFCAARAAIYFTGDLRKDVFSHVIDSSIDQIDHIGTASLITRTTVDISSLDMICFRGLRMGTAAPFTCIGSIVLAFHSNARLAMIFVAAIPLLALIYWVVIRKAAPLFAATFPKTDAVNRVIRENLTGIRVIRAFNKERAEKVRFDRVNEELTQTNIAAQHIMAWLSPLTTLVMDLAVLAILYFGAVEIDRGSFLVGDLVALTQYAALILHAFNRLTSVFQMIPRCRAAASRIEAVLNMTNTLQDPESDAAEEPQDGSISFSHVSFGYGDAEKPVLEDVSFTADSGKTTAIIGGTGSGKSTIMQLILRFYDVQQGEIRVGGVNVKSIRKEALRSMMGYAAQRAELFSGSIEENIGYGCAEATEEILSEAAAQAQAEEFISSLEEGYGAFIAQSGKNFSGGQKQRLSIARALARKPKILLFDDSFSALDYKTDAKLREALRKHRRDTTVLIVAQRVATVMDADKIVVLNEGKIEDVGTHDALLARCSFYQELVLSQLSRQEVAL